jgi:hypothetical protein
MENILNIQQVSGGSEYACEYVSVRASFPHTCRILAKTFGINEGEKNIADKEIIFSPPIKDMKYLIIKHLVATMV